MRSVLFIAALLLASFSTQASINASSDRGSSAGQLELARKAILLAYDHVKNNDVAAASATLDDAIRSEGFERLPEEARYAVLEFAAEVKTEIDDHAMAHDLWVQASGYAQARSNTWHRRLAAAYAIKDYRDSAQCVATIARRWPKTLNQIRDEAIFLIKTQLDKDTAQTEQRQVLLESLFNADWSDLV